MNDQVSNWNLFWKFLLHILLYIIFSVSLFFLLFVSVISYPSQCWFWVLHYTKLSKTSELHIHTQILVPLLLFSIAIYVSSFVFFFLPNDNITIYCICIMYKFVCITQFCRHFFCHTTANNNELRISILNLRYGFDKENIHL